MSDIDPEAHARRDLRARLGEGARYDAKDAPHSDLLTARRATANFARFLNELAEPDLTIERRRCLARVGYEARATARGIEQIASPDGEVFDIDWHVERGITLPDRALRALFQHSSIHLNVCWRDLRSADWDQTISIGSKLVEINATPALRAKSLIQAAETIRV